MWSFKDDGYCRYYLMVTGNISSLAACFFEDGGLRLDLSRCSVGSLVLPPVFFPATLGTAYAPAPPPAGPVAPRLRPPRLPGGAAGAAGPRRRSGVTGASRRPPGGPGRLFLSSTEGTSDLRSASEISLFSSKLSAHPCPPLSLSAADLSGDLFMRLFLLLPVHSSTSLLLLFLFILSFPFFSGSAPCF